MASDVSACISVIIVSYNVRELLLRCVDSALAQDLGPHDVEVIVVDNASEDDSADAVRRRFPEVQVIDMGGNFGFSRAVNRGAKEARGDRLLLLNPDARLGPGALAALDRRLRGVPWCGAVGARQVDSQGFFQLAVGPKVGLTRELGRKLVQSRLDRSDGRMARWLDARLSKPGPVPWAAASCLLVTRDAFAAVEGFDEEFFLYFEDIDFCLRLGQRGYSIWYDPSVTVVHERGRSAARVRGEAAQAYRESQRRFWQKHGRRWQSLVVAGYLGAKALWNG